MEQKELRQIAARLMSCPTAPYHEAGVRAVVETICVESGLSAQRDELGNVIIRLGSAKFGRPIAFAAHLDHPGFSVEGRLGPNRWLARFHGGVPDEYFKRNLPIRLLPGPIATRLDSRRGEEKLFELMAAAPASARPQYGVWEMTDFKIRRSRIHGRACDDLLGVAATLAALIDLKRRRARVHALGLISRAEEVGFQGALGLATSGMLAKNTFLLSLETSKELPPVKMGQGVIIRVGDRSSIFGSQATRFVTEVATELAVRAATFRFQRALMPGGTCEATAYQEYGYETAALCIALGNYHNCAPDGSIAPEFVATEDLEAMTLLLVELGLRLREYRKLVRRLPDRLEELRRKARTNLRRQP
jgi:endoglucanase